MLPEKLIILDYSGTLSRDAVLFATPDSLVKHLKESGLKDFGIDEPGKLWEDLVNPTWMEGSTTSAGYRKVLEARLQTILFQNMSTVLRSRIADAVSIFVESYFTRSRIDRRWEPILLKLHRCSSVRTIIATDHYAEATGYIIKYLQAFQIHAIPAKEDFISSGSASFIVANSADLGFHKADVRFWETLKLSVKMDTIHQILIIDDFGYSEQKGDIYGEQKSVDSRMVNTVMILESLFPAEIHLIPFISEKGDVSNDEIYGNLVMSAAARIDQYMASVC